LDVLLLSEGSHFTYRVLKTAAAAGARVHVLAGPRARTLGWSRWTASLERIDTPFAHADEAATVGQINQIIQRRKITRVLGGDAPTTRFMIGVAPQLDAPIFPSPDLATFDLLNDKGRFTELAGSLGLACPPTRRFDHKDELAAALKAGELPFPGIVKPLSRSGGAGVVRLDEGRWSAALARVTYAPLLWQSFLTDPQWDVSAFCREGEIIAFSLRRRGRGEYVFADSAEARRQTAILTRRLGVSGILDFDIIADQALTRFSWLECNPRVFFSIDFVAAAGINMIALGLGTAGIPCAGAIEAAPVKRVRKIRAAVAGLMRGEALASPDLRLALSDLSDPAMFLKDLTLETLAGFRAATSPKFLKLG
jgi:hypothetical protein